MGSNQTCMHLDIYVELLDPNDFLHFSTAVFASRKLAFELFNLHVLVCVCVSIQELFTVSSTRYSSPVRSLGELNNKVQIPLHSR